MNTPEERARADALCAAMMAMRPDLAPMSLDEWILEHREPLSDSEIAAARSILALHPDNA